SRRHLGIDGALQEPALLELPQPTSADLLGHFPHLVIDLAVAPSPVGEQVEHFDRPLATEQVEHCPRAGDHFELGRLPVHAPKGPPIGPAFKRSARSRDSRIESRALKSAAYRAVGRPICWWPHRASG